MFEGLSKKQKKTLAEIKTSERVSKSAAHSLLDALGFEMKQSGSHQVWRHPQGHQISIPFRVSENKYWRWEIKEIRTAILEMEEKEMKVITEKSKEKLSSSEMRSMLDDQALAEKKLPDRSKLDLSKVEEKMVLRQLSDAFNGLTELVKSQQELIIELGGQVELCNSKIDNLRSFGFASSIDIPITKKEPPKPSAIELARLARQEKTITKIKETIRKYPGIPKEPKVLAPLSGVGANTIKSYIEKGLI